MWLKNETSALVKILANAFVGAYCHTVGRNEDRGMIPEYDEVDGNIIKNNMRTDGMSIYGLSRYLF